MFTILSILEKYRCVACQTVGVYEKITIGSKNKENVFGIYASALSIMFLYDSLEAAPTC